MYIFLYFSKSNSQKAYIIEKRFAVLTGRGVERC